MHTNMQAHIGVHAMYVCCKHIRDIRDGSPDLWLYAGGAV